MTREWVNEEHIFIRRSKLHNILHCGIVFMSIEHEKISFFVNNIFFMEIKIKNPHSPGGHTPNMNSKSIIHQKKKQKI